MEIYHEIEYLKSSETYVEHVLKSFRFPDWKSSQTYLRRRDIQLNGTRPNCLENIAECFIYCSAHSDCFKL